MHAITAQLKKDAIPVRGLLVAMGILLVINIVAMLNTMPSLRRILQAMWIPDIHIHGSGLIGIQLVMLLFLIVRVIHQDPLTDPGAFWRSRPIARGQLLLGKSGLIAPLAILVLLLAMGSGVKDEGGVCVFTIGLAAFATVTTRFSEMMTLFLKIVLGYFALAFSLSVLLAIISALSGSRSLLNATQAFNQSDHPPAFQALLGLCFLIVIIHQYLTMKTRISVCLIFLACWAAFI